MNPTEKRAAIERYNQRLKEFGPTEKALGWGEKGRSSIRFEVLISQFRLAGQSVLDFGCGFGDLYGYMLKRGVTPSSYIGIDINAQFIDIAQRKYPNARFHVGDLEPATELPEPVDYVLSSGVFNHKLGDNKRFIADMFATFDRIAKKGCGVNFLSNHVEYELEYTYHADPCWVLDLAYNYTNNVVLRNDYMPFEFTIFLNKSAKIDPALTVYEDFLKFHT